MDILSINKTLAIIQFIFPVLMMFDNLLCRPAREQEKHLNALMTSDQSYQIIHMYIWSESARKVQGQLSCFFFSWLRLFKYCGCYAMFDAVRSTVHSTATAGFLPGR
jgi:hypothetical protein